MTRLARNELTAKLTEMGLYEGRLLKILFKAPFQDPIAVDVGGYILSLRRDEASLVYVEPVNAADLLRDRSSAKILVA